MTDRADILREPDADALTSMIATRLLGELAGLQRAGRVPSVCLTGGRIAGAVYRAVALEGPRTEIDWARLDLWWGDERFVPTGDADRNDLEALTALGPLGLAPDRVHAMPAAGEGRSLDQAASDYAAELGDTAFDICLLGVGPDGHVASLFPGHPSSSAPGRVIAVRDSPKPPPDRISLTMDVINASAQVWFCVSGEEKADAVARAVGGADLPAARAHGTHRTLWLIDEAAASRLPV